MMSGMRKAPPISISSPRETIASLALRQRVEHQQHGGGVVVDDGRGLGAGQFARAGRDVVVALAAPAGRRGRIPARTASGASRRPAACDRFLGKHGAAEIGVQHGAGEVEDRRAGSPAPASVGAAADGGEQRRFVGQWQAVPRVPRGRRPVRRDAAGDQLAAVRFRSGRNWLQDAVDRGKRVEFRSWLSPGPGRKGWVAHAQVPAPG